MVVLAVTLGMGIIGTAGAASADNVNGAFEIHPPGNGGATASCVGPVFGETPNLAPWNGHFASGGVVQHNVACDP
jgi:hypothetical protein